MIQTIYSFYDPDIIEYKIPEMFSSIRRKDDKTQKTPHFTNICDNDQVLVP